MTEYKICKECKYHTLGPANEYYGFLNLRTREVETDLCSVSKHPIDGEVILMTCQKMRFGYNNRYYRLPGKCQGGCLYEKKNDS